MRNNYVMGLTALCDTAIVQVVGRDPMGLKSLPASCFSVTEDGLVATSVSGVVLLPGVGCPVVVTTASPFVSFCPPGPRVGVNAPLLVEGTKIHVGFRAQRSELVRWCDATVVSGGNGSAATMCTRAPHGALTHTHTPHARTHTRTGCRHPGLRTHTRVRLCALCLFVYSSREQVAVPPGWVVPLPIPVSRAPPPPPSSCAHTHTLSRWVNADGHRGVT
jgi:hypothetical protein